MKFTYSSGQRVLDGYTLKRGIGRGGFGEVYYALSDGGKEVALKLVRGHNLEVEMRGMAQCLNLKHPNLMTLIDLRTDSQGDHWVVMEYISGEPLSVVLNRHPQGLPPELAQQWFIALAKAVGCLHDHGIVHRDLKPGNIFIENGSVKVGDYGLCKFISSSQRTAQTQSVGTVHYMAPEISTGNYHKQIDIYSAGIILYEMLTGRVPFDGESAGEILMKHLTSPPDLSVLPPVYVNIVGKALAKNPAHRYVSMLEMAKEVEAVGRSAEAKQGSSSRSEGRAFGTPGSTPIRPVAGSPAPVLTALPVVSPRQQAAELCGSMALVPVVAAFFSTLWMSVSSLTVSAKGNLPGTSAVPNVATEIGFCFFLTVMICWAVLVPAKLWSGRKGDSGLRRGVMTVLGIVVGLAALWMGGWLLVSAPGEPSMTQFARIVHDPGGNPPAAELGVAEENLDPTRATLFQSSEDIYTAARYLTYFGLVFFAVRWWKMGDRHRSQRFSFAPILVVGFWALGLMLMGLGPQPQGAVALVLAAAIVQLVSPWHPLPPPIMKRMRLRYT
jgi:serine/threonine protein kinase